MNKHYITEIRAGLRDCITETNLPCGKKTVGKVRDTYDLGDKLLLVTTDRQSAFDRVLAAIPFKGQVLNLASAWWFEKTRTLTDNHIIAVPHPNVTVARKCRVLPIEFVVRGYITGSTSTSLWTVYHGGHREYCGNRLPEGMRKNQRLETPLSTPTTKEAEHDRPISPAEIVAEGWLTSAEWEEASTKALSLFQFGQEQALRQGLILVDTKYEFGRDEAGNILLIDEIHTPDSSRYWIADSYEERFARGEEPQNIDKEFLRLWFIDHCDPYHDETLPEAPEELVIELSRRYVYLFETITGQKFKFPRQNESVSDTLLAAVKKII